MLIDGFGRRINYLRVSVTDRCNLRCVYCMPAEGVKLFTPQDILSYEEIFTIINVGAKLGIKRARITGGEPLVKKGLVDFVARLKSIKELEEITMTTNGAFLGKYAPDLKNAGLKRVNVSLDTLDAEKFRKITRGGDIAQTRRGIFIAQEVGLTPIKINVVLMKGVNDDEIENLAKLADDGYHVRFIELMPISHQKNWQEMFLPIKKVKSRLESVKPLLSIKSGFGPGPSSYFRWGDSRGLIGFISALSHTFCEKCNRLRLTADGKLKFCLCWSDFIDIKKIIRGNIHPDFLIADAFQNACLAKPEHHTFQDFPRYNQQTMVQIGG